MKGIRPYLLAAGVLAAACGPTGADVRAPAPRQEALFVTRLGDDTLAVERVRRTEDSVVATVLLRSPQTTLRTYRMALDDQGRPSSMRIERLDPASGNVVETSEANLSAASGIPFIDMVHWPFELMLERVRNLGLDTISLPLVAGERTVAFSMHQLPDGTFGATHPTRGTMTLAADADGRLLWLDASRTTRALRVTREADGDILALARSFAQRPMGELSGRGEVSVHVAGAQIDVDYGVPLKRGRDIFGALVPWERVWRTGANRATHFSTSRPLRVGADVIPAGTYTLFTIPRPDRWTLIVNRNIDINGQAYDADADLVHLDLAVRRLDQVVEPFTILVEPDGPSGGILRLRWDTTEAWLPFVVE
jgi:hypothetical protein